MLISCQLFLYFFFFKQKTAYEMRISDWSSDVCSSDLLIQEGNIGLMKAVKRFDPERGVRLVSFAVHWIKAEIHEYIVRNWRLVKVATTKAQRKLFFNLRRMRPDGHTLDIGRARGRERVCHYG